MTITRIKWLLIACIAFWLVVFTIAPVFANWNDDPTHPDYQNQDQEQSQSQSNTQTNAQSLVSSDSINITEPKLRVLVGAGSAAGSGTAPCLRALRSWIMVGGKHKVDQACWAEYLIQAEHERSMDLARLQLERDRLRLETLKLEQCLECAVSK